MRAMADRDHARLHPIFHNNRYATLLTNDLNNLAWLQPGRAPEFRRTQDLVGRHSRDAGILPWARRSAGAPQRGRPGAHPFWPGDRAMHGTGPTATKSPENPLNRKCRFASEKKSSVEIDARAPAEAAGEQKPLSATPIWSGAVSRMLGWFPAAAGAFWRRSNG